MNESEFETFKEMLEKIEEVRILVSEIEMKIDNKNMNGIQSDIKELYKICDYFNDMEKYIYYNYLL